MTLPQILSCSLVVAMMAAFVWGRLRYDVVALLALLAGVQLRLVFLDHGQDVLGDLAGAPAATVDAQHVQVVVGVKREGDDDREVVALLLADRVVDRDEPPA